MATDDELAAFLVRYAAACGDAGIEPLPQEWLAVLAAAMLNGDLPATQRLH